MEGTHSLSSPTLCYRHGKPGTQRGQATYLRLHSKLLPGSGVGSASWPPLTQFLSLSNLSWILTQVLETEHPGQTVHVMSPPVITVTLGQVLRTLFYYYY